MPAKAARTRKTSVKTFGKRPMKQELGAGLPEKKILVFVAHSDDQVLGPGGTIAHYAKRGYTVYSIVCSFGEYSHPHLKPEVIRKTRVQEAKRADKILGGSGVSFLGLTEGRFWDDATKDNERILKNLVKRLRKLKPERIFIHHERDPHPDHHAAFKILMEALRRSKLKPEIYTFALYRSSGSRPKFYIDVSDVFRLKILALHEFKSQIAFFTHTQTNNIIYAGVYFRAFFAGIKKGVRFAEVFEKLENGGNGS